MAHTKSPKKKMPRPKKQSKPAKRTRKRIGYCAVDSGQLMITDPAYLKYFKFDADDTDKNLNGQSNGFEYTYSGCMAATMSRKLAGQLVGWEWNRLSDDERKFSRAGKSIVSGAFDCAGVVSKTGFGDGVYPVYAEYENGWIKSVLVEFF